MIEAVLQKFGFSEKEARVYLALLKLGAAPVRVIAEAADLNRTTTHDILGTLIATGLVSFVDKDKHRYFAAESPEHLLYAVDAKKKGMEALERDIASLLPELKSLYEKSDNKPKVKYFEGKSGIRTILNDVLETVGRSEQKNYAVFSSSAIRKTIFNTFPDYNSERIKRGISVRSISIGPGGGLHGLDERKWLSKEEGSPTYTLLYAGKVAPISLDERGEPLGVVIEDKNTWETQMMIFSHLWRTLP